MTQHLSRQPCTAQLVDDRLLHAWALALHSIADGAAAQLAASTKAYAGRQAQLQPAVWRGEDEAGGNSFALESAARAVCDAIEHLEQAAEASEAGIKACTFQALDSCSLKLRDMLAAHLGRS
jgi:hypothetical protein